MWEGQAISRRSQRFAGIALAVVSLPFALIGILGMYRSIEQSGTTFAIIVFEAVSTLAGIIGLTIAYRIFFGRGVRQGGGIMSPFAFRSGGWMFLALAAYFSYETIVNGKSGNGIGVAGTLFLSFIFFVAARHRGAMRSVD